MAAPTIFLSAGEPSGDLHGARVARALLERWPNARLIGLGGPRMAAEGVETIAPFDRLAVMGFVEVVAQLPFFLNLLRRSEDVLASESVDLVVPIDYPGFNMRLAKAARRHRIPVLYFIAPQVWAWHRSRMDALAQNTDRLAVILPFEAELMRKAGADARFVGHPLLDQPPIDEPRAAFAARVGVEDRPLLAIFPGSRAQEVERHLEPFTRAARLLVERGHDLQPVIATSDAVPAAAYARAGLPTTRESRELLHHARAAIVKSGTTTLEAALAGTPMVVAYRTHPVTFWLAERLVEVDHVALVNLVAGERLVPELLQTDVTPQTLADALEPLLDDAAPERRRVLEGLAGVRRRLTPEDADARSIADRVVDLAAGLLGP